MSVEDDDEPEFPGPIPPHDEEGGAATRRRMERMVRETIRRAVEKGVETGLGTIARSEKAIRGVVGGEIPREVVSYVFSQIDETKNGLVRGVAREVRDFLEATDLATELERVLTSLSFEIKTEIRFIPNAAGGVRPSVRAKAAPKVKHERPSHDRHSPPPEEPPQADDEPDPH